MADILVVDDSEQFCAVLSQALNRRGFSVATAQSGRGVTHLVKRENVRLVLLDVIMPDQDGIETLRALKKDFPEIKIITMSGGSAHLDAVMILSITSMLGANEYLEKPFELKILFETVDRLLQPEAP